MRLATLLALALAALPAGSLAQSPSPGRGYVNTDEIAISFLAGRYSTPVTCKLVDGSQVELNDSLEIKPSPEAGGGRSLKVTFFGIQVADSDYCYSSIERRVVDRRGTLYLHFRTRNRPEYGMADFRRIANAGPLTYNAHRGELAVRGIGGDDDAEPPRVIAFDGGDSRLVVDDIKAGSDGAKLIARHLEKYPAKAEQPRRYFSLRFIAKDASEFTFYAIQEDRRWK